MKMIVADVEILIDECDVDLIQDHNWSLNRKYLKGTGGKYKGKYLHRIIAERIGLDLNKRISHANDNHFDFQRSNLIDISSAQKSIRESILIDECDMDLIRDYTWCLNTNGYLYAWVNGKPQYLHVIIAERMGLDVSGDIDHEDRNPLNNQRDNLRSATRSQNKANGKIPKNNTSGYKGVSWDKATQKWYAKITVNKKQINLGRFINKEDAARAYDRAAIKYFGEFARLNFPKSD